MPSGYQCDKCKMFFAGWSRNVIYGPKAHSCAPGQCTPQTKSYVFCESCDAQLVRLVESFVETPELCV